MRTFWAVALAALAGLSLVGAAASISTRDDVGAMFLGLLGGASLMGSLLAFRRPTEAERQAREERRARKIASRAENQNVGIWASLFVAAIIAVAGYFGRTLVTSFQGARQSASTTAPRPAQSPAEINKKTMDWLKSLETNKQIAPSNQKGNR